MGKTLRILFVEDSPDDAALLTRELQRKGFDISAERVETAEDMAAALDRQSWDILLVDYRMPRFSALGALRVVQAKGLDIPIIVVSGTLSEEQAVELMKAGAHDYLFKDNLARLVPAVERELRAFRIREAHREALLSLQESESRYRALIETSPDAILMTDLEAGYVTANRQFFALFGFESEKDGLSMLGSGRNLLALLNERNRPFGSEAIKRLLSGEPIRGAEYLARRKDGTVFSVEVSAALIKSSEGKPFAFMVICRDVTERKLMDDALRSSEERLKVIFEYAPDAYYLNDIKGTFLDGNMAAERLTGHKRHELIGKNFLKLKLISDRHLPKAAALLAKNLRGKPTGPSEFVLKRKDGKEIPVEISTHPVRIAGQVLILGIARDITERKKAEAAIVESETKYRGLVDNALVGVYQTNLEGRFLFANKALARLMGFKSPKEMLALNVNSVYVNPHSREVWLEELKKKKHLAGFELEARTKKGKTISILISGSLKDGVISGMVKDISDIKATEMALKQSLGNLRENLNDTVFSLSRVLEHRDPYTTGHQERVTNLALAIGREMGFPDNRLEGLRIAGFLHDIGKISVPSEILTKPARLNDVEMSLVKIHSQAGYDILKDIKFPWPVASIVHQHHERMDGSGYPQGLAEDKILLEARIIAIADVVEAMATHRPYRPALGVEKALEEIARGRGKQYDAAAADACLALFTEKSFEFDRPAPFDPKPD